MSTRSAQATRRVEAPAGSPLATHFAKNAILAAATAVLSKSGIAETRVEDILVAAKISRRTFYRYFASKEDVLAALYELMTGEMLTAIEAAQARRPDDPLAGIRAGIDIFLGFFRAGPRVLRELVERAIRSDSLLARRRRWFREQVVRVLDTAVHALDGRRLDPYVYHALLGALEGLTLELAATGAGDHDVERAKRVTHALVDHALGLPRPAALPRA